MKTIYYDTKLLDKKGPDKVDRNGAKRGDIENNASNQDNRIANAVEDSLDKNNLLADEDRGEYTSSLDASSDNEKLEQSDFKCGELRWGSILTTDLALLPRDY